MVCIYQYSMSMDYGHTKAKSLILCGPNSNIYLGFGYKGLVFCINNHSLVMGDLNKSKETTQTATPELNINVSIVKQDLLHRKQFLKIL